MRRRALARLPVAAALLVAAAGFWFLQSYGAARPSIVPSNASARVFSAARAEQILARILGPEKPHPVSTEENARVRARIITELSTLGLRPSVLRAFACHAPRGSGMVICASVNDIIAQVKRGTGRAIVLLAHYDSVPAGPGAADDGSGVSTVIETARALIARGAEICHPVLAVLSDGEEADLLGAVAFLHDAHLKAQVGAVINVEARGNQGPSLLFQTSPGDDALIDLYATNTADYATSSLYHEIYRFLPNDTDLTLFIDDGFPSFNFAYVGGLAAYHTARDTRAYLDPVSVQQQGDNMLGVASGLGHHDFSRLRGQDDIYFDILGRWLPRAPVAWAVPLATISFLLILVAAFLARSAPLAESQWLRAFAITPVLIVVAAASGFVLHQIAQLVSGMPDPSYAHPAALRVSLALALGGSTLLVSRLAAPRAASTAIWLSLTALGIIVALFLPGLSPYFVFPGLVAGVLFLIAALLPGSWDGLFGGIAMLIGALAALLVWSAIGTSGEALMGLKFHPLFTVPFAIGLATLVPVLARHAMTTRVWGAATVALILAAVAAAIVEGLQPTYSPTEAQRLNITYFEDRNRAVWASDNSAPLPPGLRAEATFSSTPVRLSRAIPVSYVAPAGAPLLPLPGAAVLWNAQPGGVRFVTLELHGSSDAAQMYLEIPKSAHLEAIDLRGWHFDVPKSWASQEFVALACMSRDCASAIVMLALGSRAAVNLTLYEHRFGLPGFGRRLLAARPSTAVPSQNGDGVTLMREVQVAALPPPTLFPPPRERSAAKRRRLARTLRFPG